jgi:hypothetical protein
VAKCSKKTFWDWPAGPKPDPAQGRPARLTGRRGLGFIRALGPACLFVALSAQAAPEQSVPAEFKGADLALGERLIRESHCDDCHGQRVGGNGHAIYRPAGRINRPSALLTMVEVCNTELKLQLFPEDVQAIAAVLQRDHYRFKGTP